MASSVRAAPGRQSTLVGLLLVATLSAVPRVAGGVDGGWSEYSDWSDCSEDCGPGLRTATRECNSPAPSDGGSFCEGDAMKTQPCYVKDCLVNFGDDCSYTPYKYEVAFELTPFQSMKLADIPYNKANVLLKVVATQPSFGEKSPTAGAAEPSEPADEEGGGGELAAQSDIDLTLVAEGDALVQFPRTNWGMSHFSIRGSFVRVCTDGCPMDLEMRFKGGAVSDEGRRHYVEGSGVLGTEWIYIDSTQMQDYVPFALIVTADEKGATGTLTYLYDCPRSCAECHAVTPADSAQNAAEGSTSPSAPDSASAEEPDG